MPGEFVFFFRVVSCIFVDKFFPRAYVELTPGLNRGILRKPQSGSSSRGVQAKEFQILSWAEL